MSWLPDWLTGFDRENYEAGLEADRRNAELNRQLHDRGKITDDNYAAVQLHDAADEIDADAEINDAFDDELDRRTGAVSGFVGGGINAFLKSVFGVIPWQVWILGLLAAGWYLGLFNGVLKGSLKKFAK